MVEVKRWNEIFWWLSHPKQYLLFYIMITVSDSIITPHYISGLSN